MTIALSIFQGRAGDRNGLGVPGALCIGTALAERLALSPVIVGTPPATPCQGWRDELAAATPALKELADHHDKVLFEGKAPITALPRCATALATLPVVARRFPQACVIWFDAHADLNTPSSSPTGYLGGMVLTAAAGLWDSGLGGGLRLDNLILAGVRDIDAPEQLVISENGVAALEPAATGGQTLRQAIAGRSVYVHIDCDVLEPGIVPTEYRCPGGLSLEQLHDACAVIAEGEVIGLEIAEFQESEAAGGPKTSPKPLLDALEPIIARLEAFSAEVAAGSARENAETK